MKDSSTHLENLYKELKTEYSGASELDVILQLINALPFYVLMVDEDHRIILANQAVATQFEKNVQDFVGEYCPKIIHGCEEPVSYCPLEESVRQDCVVEREHFDSIYGKWFLSAVYPTSFATKSGKKMYFHMMHDITERKIAEEELAKSVQDVHDLLK